jgi:NAD(P)-dependent dehydrogenase (short-subunit alcohol dehydrogenase family)
MKVAIVTGAAGGIGYATTEKFIEAGYHVVGLLYSTAPEAEPENIKAKFGRFGDKFVPVLGKLDCEEDRVKLVNEALKINGRIDVLANIAGVAPRVRADILEMTSESYDFVMGINL